MSAIAGYWAPRVEKDRAHEEEVMNSGCGVRVKREFGFQRPTYASDVGLVLFS